MPTRFPSPRFPPLRALLGVLALLPATGHAAPTQAATGPAPVQPGQVWTLAAKAADGEMFRTVLHLDMAPPTGTPATYHADRGVLVLDALHGTLIALDLLDARAGGLGLACVVAGPLDAPELAGVLATGTLADLPDGLKTALAVTGVARTPADRAAAIKELHLGSCTLTRAP